MDMREQVVQSARLQPLVAALPSSTIRLQFRQGDDKIGAKGAVATIQVIERVAAEARTEQRN